MTNSQRTTAGWPLALLVSALALSACSDSSTSGAPLGSPDPVQDPAPDPAPAPDPDPDPTPDPPPEMVENAFSAEASTARFLVQSTFGPTAAQVSLLTGTNPEDWIASEFARPVDVSYVAEFRRLEDEVGDASIQDMHDLFWRKAVYGDDQLRQRAAFALSQIFVVSSNDEVTSLFPMAFADYMDHMQNLAFGNYRDLLEEVTYSGSMSRYLTYFQNLPADTETGRVPDENYAREIMQLFSIGLIELNPNGEPQLDGSGQPIETYDNTDIVNLARVFTGLSWDGEQFFAAPDERVEDFETTRLRVYEDQHSPREKAFLGAFIPAGTPGDASIAIALDTLFEHPNTAPFVSRQLIQRMVTSNPSPAYVGRVAQAFLTGAFQGPGGRDFGSGERGDLQAVWAAILLDDEARSATVAAQPEFGKVREPVIRFAHFARNFVPQANASPTPAPLQDTRPQSRLAQQAFRSPSVFNFFRPGYVAPGTLTAEAGLVAPELQIANTASIGGYIDFMADFVSDQVPGAGYAPDYTAQLQFGDDLEALVDDVDIRLTGGMMRPETRARILNALSSIPLSADPAEADGDRRRRIHAAVFMAATSSEFLVQR